MFDDLINCSAAWRYGYDRGGAFMTSFDKYNKKLSKGCTAGITLNSLESNVWSASVNSKLVPDFLKSEWKRKFPCRLSLN